MTVLPPPRPPPPPSQGLYPALHGVFIFTPINTISLPMIAQLLKPQLLALWRTNLQHWIHNDTWKLRQTFHFKVTYDWVSSKVLSLWKLFLSISHDKLHILEIQNKDTGYFVWYEKKKKRGDMLLGIKDLVTSWPHPAHTRTSSSPLSPSSVLTERKLHWKCPWQYYLSENECSFFSRSKYKINELYRKKLTWPAKDRKRICRRTYDLKRPDQQKSVNRNCRPGIFS